MNQTLALWLFLINTWTGLSPFIGRHNQGISLSLTVSEFTARESTCFWHPHIYLTCEMQKERMTFEGLFQFYTCESVHGEFIFHE